MPYCRIANIDDIGSFLTSTTRTSTYDYEISIPQIAPTNYIFVSVEYFLICRDLLFNYIFCFAIKIKELQTRLALISCVISFLLTKKSYQQLLIQREDEYGFVGENLRNKNLVSYNH